MGEKRHCITSSTNQVKNLQRTISIEEKLGVISRLEKGERIVVYAMILYSRFLPNVQFV